MKVRSQEHIWFYDDRTEIRSTNDDGKDAKRIYAPSPTGYLFEKDNSFVQLVMGPYGSGKTTMCLQKIVKLASQMPKWSNGRSKSRWAIIRNTSPELHSTTLKSWISWFGELGDIVPRQKPILTYNHTFRTLDGIVELELMFIALDREDDIRKLKSMELTGAYINELSEVPQAVLSHLKGRLNHRYPSRSFCNSYYWSGVLADTNPPDEDHWIHNEFESNPVEGYKIFKQPPGLIRDKDGKWEDNKNSDNAINLAHVAPNNSHELVYDYYSKLATGQSEQFIKVYCLGEYGIVGIGKRVYPEYNDDLHSVDDLQVIQGDPINLGWDGGLTPACVVIQISPRGQLLILKEYCTEDMGMRTFVENVVLPSLKVDFPYNPVIGLSMMDPSGIKRDDIVAEFSAIGEINNAGIKTEGAYTNDIQTRINSVRFFLNRMVDGRPCLVLSRKGCPILRRGFARDYIYKRLAVSGDERYRDLPDKNRFSHPHDAVQYIAMEFASDRIAENKSKKQTVNMFNPTFRFG